MVHLHSHHDYHSAVDIVVELGIATDTARMAAGPDSLELQHTNCRIQEVVAEALSQSCPDQVEEVANLAVAVGIVRNHSGYLASVAGYVLGMSYVTGCHSSGSLLVPLLVLLLYRGTHRVIPGHLGYDQISRHAPLFVECRPR